MAHTFKYLQSTTKHAIHGAAALAMTMILALCANPVAIAQSAPDLEPPIIEVELVEDAPAGFTQVFTAQVTDDQSLGDVSLHVRRAGTVPFQKLLMTPIDDTGLYSVIVNTEPDDTRAFEYYVQALDLIGNRTVSGFAFDPFVRTLSEAVQPEPALATKEVPNSTTAEATSTAQVATVASAPPRKSTSSVRRWAYVALGVLAAGAVASQLGSSSGGGGSVDPAFGDDGPGGQPTGPLTVNTGVPLP